VASNGWLNSLVRATSVGFTTPTDTAADAKEQTTWVETAEALKPAFDARSCDGSIL